MILFKMSCLCSLRLTNLQFRLHLTTLAVGRRTATKGATDAGYFGDDFLYFNFWQWLRAGQPGTHCVPGCPSTTLPLAIPREC